MVSYNWSSLQTSSTADMIYFLYGTGSNDQSVSNYNMKAFFFSTSGEGSLQNSNGQQGNDLKFYYNGTYYVFYYWNVPF